MVNSPPPSEQPHQLLPADGVEVVDPADAGIDKPEDQGEEMGTEAPAGTVHGPTVRGRCVGGPGRVRGVDLCCESGTGVPEHHPPPRGVSGDRAGPRLTSSTPRSPSHSMTPISCDWSNMSPVR